MARNPFFGFLHCERGGLLRADANPIDELAKKEKRYRSLGRHDNSTIWQHSIIDAIPEHEGPDLGGAEGIVIFPRCWWGLAHDAAFNQWAS